MTKQTKIITDHAIAQKLMDLGVIPPNCKEFTIRIAPLGVIETTAVCLGTEELFQVDWSVVLGTSATEEQIANG